MLLSRYILRIALLVAVVAASFAAGMVVMEAASKTGNHPQFFAIAALIAIGGILVATFVYYRMVVNKAAGMVLRRIRD
jgi:phosphoglycerol transferase MdoB-like AlkP superfamily enzyme